MGLDKGGENVKDLSHHSISIHFIFLWVHAHYSGFSIRTKYAIFKSKVDLLESIVCDLAEKAGIQVALGTSID